MHFLKYDKNPKKIEFINIPLLIDKITIKNAFFNKYKIPFVVPNFNKITKNDLKIDIKLQTQLNGFLNILSSIIIDSEVLWTTSYLFNQIESIKKDIVDKKMSSWPPMNVFSSIYLYLNNASYDKLILIICHFFKASQTDDYCWSKIKNELLNSLNQENFKKTCGLVDKWIKDNDINDKLDKLKIFRNNLLAHLTSKDILRDEITVQDSKTIHHKYSSPQKPPVNIIFEICTAIKQIFITLSDLYDPFRVQVLSFVPNIFMIDCEVLQRDITPISWSDEIQRFYFCPSNWLKGSLF